MRLTKKVGGMNAFASPPGLPLDLRQSSVSSYFVLSTCRRSQSPQKTIVPSQKRRGKCLAMSPVMTEFSKPGPAEPRVDNSSGLETFFVTCPKGIGKMLAKEIESPEIGGSVTKVFPSGVEFTAPSMRAGYAACLWLRTGIRVLHLLQRTLDISENEPGGDDFTAMYNFVRTAADWPALLRGTETHSFSIQVREPPPKERGDNFDRGGGYYGRRQNPARRTTREAFGSHRAQVCAKNAICDVLRDAGLDLPGRPTSHSDADVPLFLALKDGEASFYRDMAGSSLHKRGYRSDSVMHRSSLNEAVAAGMLMLAGFTPCGSFKSGRREALAKRKHEQAGNAADKPGRLVLVDPMCGSGTLLIEAALLRLHVAPGLYRREFPFERWGDFDAVEYQKLVEEAVALQRSDEGINIELIGNDYSPAALNLARKDLERTQLSHLVRLVQGDADQLKLERDASLVVSNPPWGMRLEDEEVAWEQLGTFLRNCAPGGSAIVLSGDPSLTSGLRMRAREKHPIRIGNVDCRAIVYDVLERLPAGAVRVPQRKSSTRSRPEPRRREMPVNWEKPEL